MAQVPWMVMLTRLQRGWLVLEWLTERFQGIKRNMQQVAVGRVTFGQE